MIKTHKITDIYNKMVYTDSGEYFGDVEESVLTSNKVFGWRVRATKNSYLSKTLGGAKGVVVPHQFVKSIGDVVIIKREAMPSEYDDSAKEEPL